MSTTPSDIRAELPLPALSGLITLLFSQAEAQERLFDPVGQASWCHSAPGFSHLALPFPPHLHLQGPLICCAAALEWYSLQQITFHLDHQVH